MPESGLKGLSAKRIIEGSNPSGPSEFFEFHYHETGIVWVELAPNREKDNKCISLFDNMFVSLGVPKHHHNFRVWNKEKSVHLKNWCWGY